MCSEVGQCAFFLGALFSISFLLDMADCTEPKTERIRSMFDSIATRYDILNKLMTFGIDRSWRRRTVRSLIPFAPRTLLDIAVGTGDLALDLAQGISSLQSIIGVDISKEMLECGRRKVAEAKVAIPITLEEADCASLPFADGSFDAITCAFGVRNFEQLEVCLGEMYRVTAEGGHVAILELSVPRNSLLRMGYTVWTRTFIPTVGTLVAHNREAYTYLPKSIRRVPQYDAFTALLAKVGFSQMHYYLLSGGIATLYIATR